MAVSSCRATYSKLGGRVKDALTGCSSKVILTGVNSNVIMSGLGGTEKEDFHHEHEHVAEKDFSLRPNDKTSRDPGFRYASSGLQGVLRSTDF
jgi:hypothetical protein